MCRFEDGCCCHPYRGTLAYSKSVDGSDVRDAQHRSAAVNSTTVACVFVRASRMCRFEGSSLLSSSSRHTSKLLAVCRRIQARTYERQEAGALSTSSSGDSYPPSVSPRKPSREARPCKLHDILAVPNRGLFGAVPRQPATRRWTAGESVQRIGTKCLAPMKPQSLAASARKAR